MDRDRTADEVETERQAVEECQKLLDVGTTASDVEDEVESADQLLEIQLCLAELGIESETQNGALVIDDSAGDEVIQSALSSCE